MQKNILKEYIPKENDFYANHYYHILIGLIIFIFLLVILVSFIFYQVESRPLPQFHAIEPNNQRMPLTAYEEPNLLPDTILRWASKAATLAYTFNYSDYILPNPRQFLARPYFTDNGWNAYRQSIAGTINSIVQNRLLVYSVVSGAPVIANQGPLPGKGFVWRVQIPFLVTYQSENTSTTNSFLVILSIVRVPTHINPAGIGIDQFIMV